MTNFSVKTLACAIAMATLVSGCAFKKMKKKQSTIGYQTTPEVLEVHADSVKFEYKGYMPKKYFAKKAQMELTPVLKYGADSLSLKTGYLRGEKIDGDGTMVLKKEGDTISFGDRFSYSESMSESELFLDLVAKRKKKTVPFLRVKLAEGVITTSQSVKSTEELIYSKDNYQKVVPVEKKGTLLFDIDRAIVKETEKKGAAAKDFSEFIKAGNNLTGVAISSFASPDGELKRNNQLSIDRTKATYSFILGFLKKNGVNQVNDSAFYKRSATAEDWDGLSKAASNSNLAEKERLMRLISGISDVNQREQELKKLDEYKEIAQTLLPKLRRSEVTFIATEKRKSDDQILALAKSNPNVLTAEELLYATTLTTDANEKVAIYEKFINIFPTDWRGYNSMACVYLEQGNTDKAEEMLNKAAGINKNNAAVYNNFGVLYLRKKDYKRAEENFLQAKTLGAKEDLNLGNTKVKQGDYKAAVAYYGISNSATYNCALANAMSGSYEVALVNINAIKEPDASVFYLKAIIGARKGDQETTTTNITRAIKLDASYRAKAVKDLEFRKYRETDAFKAAVR